MPPRHNHCHQRDPRNSPQPPQPQHDQPRPQPFNDEKKRRKLPNSTQRFEGAERSATTGLIASDPLPQINTTPRTSRLSLNFSTSVSVRDCRFAVPERPRQNGVSEPGLYMLSPVCFQLSLRAGETLQSPGSVQRWAFRVYATFAIL